MNLFTKQPEGASPVLTPLCVRKGSMGCVSEGLIWFQGHAQSHLVQARRVSNPTSPDVCRTPVLWLQHHLSPVTNWQLKAKDVFLIILHSLNAAVTTVDAGMHAKLFCHVKISWDALKKKRHKTFEAYSPRVLKIPPFVVDDGKCSTKPRLNLGPV